MEVPPGPELTSLIRTVTTGARHGLRIAVILLLAATAAQSIWDLLAPEVAIPAALLLGFLLASALATRRLLARSR